MRVVCFLVVLLMALTFDAGGSAWGEELEDWQRKGLLAALSDSRTDVQEVALRSAFWLEALDIVPVNIAVTLTHSRDADAVYPRASFVTRFSRRLAHGRSPPSPFE